MEELIDVLDENGNKTGEILTKRQIHERGLCHKIIVVAIIDGNGHILMQKRAKNKDVNAEKWDVSVAGHVLSGQTSIESAIRETFEELGIRIYKEELKYILMYKNKERIRGDYIDNQIYDCYIVNREVNLKDIKIQESEVETVKFCNLDEFKNLISSQNVMNREKLYKEIIRYLK